MIHCNMTKLILFLNFYYNYALSSIQGKMAALQYVEAIQLQG